MIAIRLLVCDAAPLITLGVTRSLHLLAAAGVPVAIPDAVFYEATAGADKLGAIEIIEWYRENPATVRVEPTEVFQDAIALATSRGRRLPRDLGERSALEVARGSNLLDEPGDRAILLTDDRGTRRLIVTEPEKIVLLTTLDFLRRMEEARKLQSADAIIEEARARGRNPATFELFAGHDPEVRDAVRAILQPREKP
jgi:hypothetical protein